MQNQVVEWLLEESNPSVRYLTLTTLLDVSQEDETAVEARHAIMHKGIVPDMLAAQNEDGSWGKAERFYTDKYTGTVWNLLILAEMNASPENQQVKNACEFILRNSQEPEEGGFSYTQSAKTGVGLYSGVIPCLTGNMVYSLVKLGCLQDERVQRAIEWITAYQRADDLEGNAPKDKAYQRYEMCWGRHSCHMGVAKALKALSVVPPEACSQQSADKRDMLVEYFLKHQIHKKSHDLTQVSRPGWLKLGFPLMYQTDILELLDILTDLKIRDPRMQEAFEIIKSKEMQDGRWKLENSFNGKLTVDVEKKGQPSKWITLKALRVMKKLGDG